MIVGKWHCGDQPEFLPLNHGFDYYYGLPYSNDMGRQVGIKEMLPPLPLIKDDEVIQEQPDLSSLTERYVEKAVSFIRDNKEGPFFLYFAHMHVHIPHYTPERFMKNSKNGEYGAAVETIDWSTSVIMDELDRLGIDENTLVIFTSDNGSRSNNEGGSNAPCRGRKTTSWEGGFRVPCLMRWPNRIPKGIVTNHMASNMDFLPTLAHIAGSEVPTDRKIDGVDLQPLMDGKDEVVRNEFFYYCDDFLEAVRVGKWKLHIRKHGQDFNGLYNLDEDISETNNLYEKHPEIVEALMERIESCKKDLGHGDQPGKNVRPIGRVKNPKPLTEYDENHPYIMAMYDKPQRG